MLRLGWIASLLLVCACAPRPRTQITVIVEADDDVVRDATSMIVRVEGGPTRPRELEYPVSLGPGRVEFPVEIALIPATEDLGRVFRLEASASDATGGALGTVRVISSFVPERTLTLTLRLESCCRRVACGVEETCRGCACVPATVEIERLDAHVVAPDAWSTGLPDATIVSADAPRADAFAPGVDAFATDAHVPGRDAYADDAVALAPDAFAAPDAFSADAPPSCLVPRGCDTVPRSGLVVGMSISETTRWSRPTAASCPASLAGGTYGYSVRRLYNPGSTAVRQGLRTFSGTGVDLFLALYAEPSPDLDSFPALPADARDCILALDDTPGEAPNVVTSVDVPPRQAVIVVMTTSLPEAMGHAQLTFE